jgi:hypothetical protein
MLFDAQRWPNAVTIGWLIAERIGRGVAGISQSALG